MNELQPWHSPRGNISLYVCQRTVRLGHNGYKCLVDGWSQCRLILSWHEQRVWEPTCVVKKEHPCVHSRRTHSGFLRRGFFPYLYKKTF